MLLMSLRLYGFYNVLHTAALCASGGKVAKRFPLISLHTLALLVERT